MKERKDGLWTLPGGWADVGESPSVTAIREVKEESGYDVVVRKLAAVYDRDKHGHPPMAYMRPSVTRNRPYGVKEAEIFLNEVLPSAPHVPIQIAHLAERRGATGLGGAGRPYLHRSCQSAA